MPTTLRNTDILFNDGSTQSTAAAGPRTQLFLSSGTFTVPSGITSVFVRVWGAGGGGRGGTRIPLGGAGSGGSGGYVEAAVTGLTPGASITVTVGTGGNGSSGNTTAGSGGTSSFGTFASSTGGAGGGNFINGTSGSGSVSGATRITNNSNIGVWYGAVSGAPGTNYIFSCGDFQPGGGGGGGGFSSGGGGGSMFNPAGVAGDVNGAGNAGSNGTVTSFPTGGNGGNGGSPGGSGAVGGSQITGGGGGGGGGVMVFW